jgi:hypothetical protein
MVFENEKSPKRIEEFQNQGMESFASAMGIG